jgi:hypothetical protein
VVGLVYTSPVDVVVSSLTAVVQDVGRTIPLGIIAKATFLHRCSNSLRKSIIFTEDFKRRNPTSFAKNFPLIVNCLTDLEDGWC